MAEGKDSLIAEESNTPPAIKIGDKEYTAEEITALEAKAAKLEEDHKSMQSDYTKKSMKLAEYEKLAEKVDNVNSGDIAASDLTEQEMADLKYMKRLGLITKAEHDKVLSQALEEKEKELIKEITVDRLNFLKP